MSQTGSDASSWEPDARFPSETTNNTGSNRAPNGPSYPGFLQLLTEGELKRQDKQKDGETAENPGDVELHKILKGQQEECPTCKKALPFKVSEWIYCDMCAIAAFCSKLCKKNGRKGHKKICLQILKMRSNTLKPLRDVSFVVNKIAEKLGSNLKQGFKNGYPCLSRDPEKPSIETISKPYDWVPEKTTGITNNCGSIKENITHNVHWCKWMFFGRSFESFLLMHSFDISLAWKLLYTGKEAALMWSTFKVLSSVRSESVNIYVKDLLVKEMGIVLSVFDSKYAVRDHIVIEGDDEEDDTEETFESDETKERKVGWLLSSSRVPYVSIYFKTENDCEFRLITNVYAFRGLEDSLAEGSMSDENVASHKFSLPVSIVEKSRLGEYFTDETYINSKEGCRSVFESECSKDPNLFTTVGFLSYNLFSSSQPASVTS